MTNTEIANASTVMLGTTEASAMYIGSTLLWLKLTLPYDAEVEYLESNGTQHINTGIVNNSTVVVDCKMAGQGTDVLNGAEYNSSYKFKWGIGGEGNPYLGYGSTNNNYNYGVPVTISDIYVYHIEQGSQTISDTSNNILVSSTATLSKYSTKPIYLFRLMRGNLTTTNGTMRIYYCNIEDDGVLHEFIPVRVGLVGYMYDKQSGQLFANAGSGSFTLGPDKQ